MSIADSAPAVNVSPDWAKFLTALFSPRDWIEFRPMEVWDDGGRRRSRIIWNRRSHKRLGVSVPGEGIDGWRPLPPNLIGQQLIPIIETGETEQANIFIGVCPRFGGGGYDHAFQIRQANALWADIDGVADAGEVVQRLKNASLPRPSIAVNSGNGFHLYWLLDSPYTINDCGTPAVIKTDFCDTGDKREKREWIIDPENGEKTILSPATEPTLSPMAIRFQDMLSGLAECIGGDHVKDLARVLRLPATLNRKNERNGQPPKPCTLIRCDSNCRYPLKDFERFIEKSECRRRREKVAKVALPSVHKLKGGKREDELNALVLACRICDVGNRSEEDYHLCCRSIELGIGKDDVWARVADVGKFAEKGRDYFDRTWDKAISHTQERILEKAIAKQEKKTGAAQKGAPVAAISDDEGDVKYIADLICLEHHFAQDEGGKLYAYRDGAYRRRGDEFVRRLVQQKCNALRKTERWSPTFADNIVEYIRLKSPELWERPPVDVLNVRNGLLRIADRVLLPHSPDHLSPIQLPMAFDPSATCPAIEKYVNEAFPPDATMLAWEVAAWLMRPDTSIQKAVLLIGPGGNGKSVWLGLLASFLGGRENVSGVSLHKLEADKFAGSRLYGKLANICPDLPSEHLAGTSIFKAITGGDTLTGEYKFKDSFDFVPFARLVFSANHAPRSEDSSQGFFDRWLIIPFDRPFRGTEAEIPKNELDERLRASGELSGLLNKALDALPRITGRCGFTMPESVQAAFRDFQATTDPLAVWLDRCTIDDPDAFIARNTLRVAFNAHLDQHGIPLVTDKAFGTAFAKHRPNVQSKQRTVGGRVAWCYVGIGMLPTGPAQESEASHLSQDSQDSPSLFPSHARNDGDGERKSTAEQSRGNPVNAVNPVNGCSHTDPATWVQRGSVAYCPGCDKPMGRVRS